MFPLIPELCGIVFSYLNIIDLFKMQKLCVAKHGISCEKEVKYYLGNKNILEKRVENNIISCGTDHTMMISTDGILYGCGRNKHGSLGLGHYVNIPKLKKIKEGISSVLCKMNSTMIISKEGILYKYGDILYKIGRASCRERV